MRGSKEILEYELETLEYSQEEMENLLNTKFEQFCEDLEAENAIIKEKNLSITQDHTGAKAQATLILQEEVGIHRKIVDF